MSRFSRKFSLPGILILSMAFHLSAPMIQAMESSKHYSEQNGITLSPLLQVFLTHDLKDQFKAILEPLDDGDLNSLFIATAKHVKLLPLQQLIKETLAEKCAGWFFYDLDDYDLSPYSYAPYIARSFYFRLIDLIKAQNEPMISTNNTRQSLQEFLNSIPSLQNHSASYFLHYLEKGEGEITLAERALQGDQGASEIFLLLYTFAKKTSLIPLLNDDLCSETRMAGIMHHTNDVANHTLKQLVLFSLDADQASMLGDLLTLRGKKIYLSYLDLYQSLYDARQCFRHAQTLTSNKIRFATLNQYIGNTYMEEAQLRDKQGSLEIALEKYTKALLYFLKPDPILGQEEIKDQDQHFLNDYRYSNRQSIYQCLKKEAKLYSKIQENTKALNNFKSARKMFALWMQDEDASLSISDKLTALQNRGICYAKEGAIHQLMNNDVKALTSFQKARDLFIQVIMERPDFNATILEYHFANCFKNEGAIYYKQRQLVDALSFYKQAEIYFTDARRIRIIFPHWKAQYGLASCLIKQVCIHRLLGKENDIKDLKRIKKALYLLSPILKLIDHSDLRKKVAKMFNACLLDLKKRDINIKEFLKDGEIFSCLTSELP